ncbi:hypothetical protein [Prosthecochloris sp.]|uniref:hypothetical protein n=1 Tax=Prosthecochloris sp. TaxID=290513 RepID=UPI0025797611|nr:hypothetical protein [Prosthecochloris sp.]
MSVKAIISAFLLILTSCATTGGQFHVNVSSLASSAANEKGTYFLLPGNDGVTFEDLQFQEYAAYVKRILDAEGFIYAPNVKNADVAVILSYGIGEPQTTQYTYSLPVWGQTGVSAARTSGTVSVYGNTATYSGNTTYTPSYGVTGMTSHVGTETTYDRYAQIAGFDYQTFLKSQKVVELWKTTITSTGSSGDLRRVFPILIGAASPYIAKNTGKAILVKLSENDKTVRIVKGEQEEKK